MTVSRRDRLLTINHLHFELVVGLRNVCPIISLVEVTRPTRKQGNTRYVLLRRYGASEKQLLGKNQGYLF